MPVIYERIYIFGFAMVDLLPLSSVFIPFLLSINLELARACVGGGDAGHWTHTHTQLLAEWANHITGEVAEMNVVKE